MVYGVIAGIATLYGVVLARRFKAPEIVEGPKTTWTAWSAASAARFSPMRKRRLAGC